MDEFIENFNEFREFLNSQLTEHMVKTLVDKDASAVLKLIKDKFQELGLNDAF